MNEQERKELTGLVYQALLHAAWYGDHRGTAAVVLDHDGQLIVACGGHEWRETVLEVADVGDVLGQRWDDSIGGGDEPEDASMRKAAAEAEVADVEAALRDGAQRWVDSCGESAVAAATDRRNAAWEILRRGRMRGAE